jgi:penicillin amidase
MSRMQMDTVSLPARALLPRLLDLEPSSEEEAWALELLRGWDGDQEAGSAAAAVYNAWLARICWLLLGGEEGRATFDRYHAWREAFVCRALPRLLAAEPPPWAPEAAAGWGGILGGALREALGQLRDRLGADRGDWRWGALHRVRFGHPLARMPGLAPMFVAAEHELGGDEQTVLQAGFDARGGFEAAVVPSWRFVADLADVDRSVAVSPTGQSGNPASPHWNDQAPLWIAGELRPAPVTRAGVEAAAERALVLRPAR